MIWYIKYISPATKFLNLSFTAIKDIHVLNESSEIVYDEIDRRTN